MRATLKNDGVEKINIINFLNSKNLK
jgi:hypothetical protein